MNNPSSIINSNLLNENIHADEYKLNEKYKDHLLEQYKIYIEMADRISARRNLSNTFFLTLNTLVISVIGFSIENIPVLRYKILVFLPLVTLLILCYSWWKIVKSYQQLNKAKYGLIIEFEKNLPAKPWASEWIELGEGEKRNLYQPLTDLENWAPIAFSFIYVFLAFSYILL